jgi:hypothetical protein
MLTSFSALPPSNIAHKRMSASEKEPSATGPVKGMNLFSATGNVRISCDSKFSGEK